MQTRYGLGIDIGGSSAKLGVVSSEGQILHRAVAPMGRFLEAGEMIESLARSVRELLNWAEKASVGLAGIGIGHPGFYDEQGHLRDLCNLPALNGLNLAGLFQERFGLPARSDTDVSCGTLGEFHFGQHRAVDRFLFLTLGTGVGAGVVINGNLMRTTRNCLGDPGHVIVDSAGAACTCGGQGCLEAVVSGWAITRQAEELIGSGRATLLSQVKHQTGTVMPTEVFAAAAGGDEVACGLVQRVAKYLAMGLATLSIIFEPERIVLGGGIATGAGDQLLMPVRAHFFRMLQPAFARNTSLMTAMVGADAGLLGAAHLGFGDLVGRPEAY